MASIASALLGFGVSCSAIRCSRRLIGLDGVVLEDLDRAGHVADFVGAAGARDFHGLVPTSQYLHGVRHTGDRAGNAVADQQRQPEAHQDGQTDANPDDDEGRRHRRLVACLALIHQHRLLGGERGHDRPEGVEVLLAAGLADQVGHVVHGLGVADLPAQGDGRLGDVLLPFADGLLDLGQQRHLGRIIVHGLAQARDKLIEPLGSVRVGRQELVLAGQQIAAHAGLHVDRRREDVVGLLDHLVGVGDPRLVLVHDPEIRRDLGSRAGRRLLAFGHQVPFDLAEGRDLDPEGVEELLSGLSVHEVLDVLQGPRAGAHLAPQRDRRLGHLLDPVPDSGLRLLQPLDLRRVVVDRLLQGLHAL